MASPHFAASVMIGEHIPLPDVAKMLGHRHFDMTLQVYAHPVRELSHHQAAFDRMAGAIGRTATKLQSSQGV